MACTTSIWARRRASRDHDRAPGDFRWDRWMEKSVAANIVSGLMARRLMWIVWPAFLVAGVAEIVFFSVFDPFELHFFGDALEISREGLYTIGFFGFWGLGIASSALTMFLEGSSPGGHAAGGEGAEAP
jgi:hypothetical protein